MDHDREIVLVTGVSSAIGNACATLLAKKGFGTYAACRDPARYEKKADEFFELLPMDLSDDSSVTKAVAALLAKEGKIDHLVFCGEVGLVGSVEGCSIDEARNQIEADYLGALRLIKALLPSMREKGSGRILILSSLAAKIGLPFVSHYSAVARGLEALVESLRIETRPFGIEACSLELGVFRAAFPDSPWTASVQEKEAHYREAREVLERSSKRIARAAGLGPFAAAKAACALLGRKRLPGRKSIAPLPVRIAVLAKRLLPESLFERYVSRLVSRIERKEH